MNYWLAYGLLVLAVAAYFHARSRRAKERIRELGVTNANDVAVALSPWVLYPLALLFITVGIVDSL